MQRRRTCDHDERPDHTGHDRADDDVDLLIPQVGGGEPFVRAVGLNEGKPPGGEGGPDSRGGEHERRGGQARDDHALCGRAPVRSREQSGGDVGDENRPERQQDVLDAMEALLQDEHADADGRNGDADVSAHPGKVGSGSDSRELGASGPEVRRDQGRGDHYRGSAAVPVAHEPDHSALGHQPHPRSELVEDDERSRG